VGSFIGVFVAGEWVGEGIKVGAIVSHNVDVGITDVEEGSGLVDEAFGVRVGVYSG
jgi:hypothetical protein